MVTAFKVSKDLNNTTLEEFISSLRSHEIEIEENEHQKKVKYVALKSKCKPGKDKTLKSEEEEFGEKSEEEDELSLLSRRETNSRRKYKQSSKASEEHVDDLSQPLGRSSLELTRMLPDLSANNLDIIKKSLPNPCLRRRFLWKPGMTLKL